MERSTHLDAVLPTSDRLAAHEELVRVRCGAWQLLVPASYVERVHGAAMPAARPDTAGSAPPVVALGRELVPVVFAEALLGAGEVRLAADHQMILLRVKDARALLWVDAVEEVIEHAAMATPAEGGALGDLVAAWSGADRPLPVLDIPRLLALVTAGAPTIL